MSTKERLPDLDRSGDRFTTLEKLLESADSTVELEPADIVRRAEDLALSIAEATAALHELETSGGWERVLLDERGRTLTTEEANAIAAASMLGFGARLRVVWRRREPRAVLAA